MQTRRRVPTIPLTALGNELKALKLKFIRRTSCPEEVLGSVMPQIISQKASLTLENASFDASAFREVGEFALNFSYLVSRVCEQQISSSSQNNTEPHPEDEDELQFIDPTSDLHKPENFVPLSSVSSPSSSSSLSPIATFTSRRRRLPWVEYLPSVTCQSIHVLLQQYISSAHIHNEQIKLQHINGVIRTSLLLRDHFKYAFQLKHESESLEETVQTSYAMMLRYIHRNKHSRVRKRHGRMFASSTDIPVVPTNAIINALDICDKIDGKGIYFGAIGGPINIRSLLPIKSDVQMEAKLQKCGIAAAQLMNLLLETDPVEFNFADASTLIHVLGKAGLKNKDLIEKCLIVIYEMQGSSSRSHSSSLVSPSAIAQILFSCGIMGISHPLLSKIARPSATLERPDAKLLRTLAMAGSMLNLDPVTSQLTPALWEKWWKRLACKTDVAAPFHILADIGHALRSMDIVSPKANYSLSQITDATLKQSDLASFLQSQSLTTLLKGMYLFGNTPCRKGDQHWDASIKNVTRVIASEALHQIKSKSIIHEEDLIGGEFAEVSTSVSSSDNERRKMENYRHLQEVAYEGLMVHCLAHCGLSKVDLEDTKRYVPSAPETKKTTTNETLLSIPPHELKKKQEPNSNIMHDENQVARPLTNIKSSDSPVTLEPSTIDALSTASRRTVASDQLKHSQNDDEPKGNASKPLVVRLGDNIILPSKAELTVDTNAKFLIDTQWSLLSRKEVIQALVNINPANLDASDVYLLFERVTDNIDGSLQVQQEITGAMGPLLKALRYHCRDAPSAFTTVQLVDLLSFCDLLGEPLASAPETAAVIAELLSAIAKRISELTRAQSEDVLGSIESFIPYFDDSEVQSAGENLEKSIRFRFKNL